MSSIVLEHTIHLLLLLLLTPEWVFGIGDFWYDFWCLIQVSDSVCLCVLSRFLRYFGPLEWTYLRRHSRKPGHWHLACTRLGKCAWRDSAMLWLKFKLTEHLFWSWCNIVLSGELYFSFGNYLKISMTSEKKHKIWPKVMKIMRASKIKK